MRTRALPLVALLVVVAWPARAGAQVIHDHPQKAFYASPAEYPKRDSQGHWKPSNAVLPPADQIVQALKDGTFVPTTGHTHVMLQCPQYAEWPAGMTVRCEFMVMLFRTAGRNVDFYAGTASGAHAAKEIFWDETQSSQRPETIGDPTGLKMWHGHFLVDPDPAVQHGSVLVVASTFTMFDNGDVQRVAGGVELWSMLDPTAPIDGSQFRFTFAHSIPDSPRRPDVNFGTNQIDIQGLLPIAPISAPWTFPVGVLRYGFDPGDPLPAPTFQVRADIDLHHDIPGRIIQQVDDPKDGTQIFVTLDPAVLGPGTHKIALVFIQPDGGLEEASTLETFDVTVGDSVPVPTTCTDPTATNFGGLLPCLYPLPPPPMTDTWQSIVPWFEQDVINGVPQLIFRFCISPTQCFALPNVPRL